MLFGGFFLMALFGMIVLLLERAVTIQTLPPPNPRTAGKRSTSFC